jgi:FixJ family two-component response regulator
MSTAVISHERIVNQTHVLHRGCRTSLGSDTDATVFAIHEDASVRAWLGTLLRNEGWRLEAYASAREFFARPRAVHPNCLVLDVSLSGLSSLELQKRLAVERPDMPIIFIADQVDVPTTVKAIKAGAVELFMRPFPEDLLLNSVREALEGSSVAIDREAEMQVLRDRYRLLTSRERQVMLLVVAGLLNKQVGGELGISEITVKAHRGQAMQKMKANSLPDLVKMAGRLGLASSLKN